MKNTLAFLNVLFMTSVAFADGGTSVGGGGQGIQCRTSIEILDLYEARFAHNQDPFLSSSSDLKEHIKQAQNNLNEIFPQEKWLDSVFKLAADYAEFKNINFQESPLALTNDWGSIIVPIPKSCYIVQIAAFLGGKVTIDLNLWNRLSTTSRAALLIHEALHTKLNFNFTNLSGEKFSDNYAIRSAVVYLTSSYEFRLANKQEMLLTLQHFDLYAIKQEPGANPDHNFQNPGYTPPCYTLGCENL